ncbi:hypothetical protein K0M31_018889 [Melipona bicolor]|uniref:Uncharacterized protein n=1 Tax=Melipona bicolor TaxID=60889 RepID=A0AA40KS51_9HYME|nr:hypothetical protein K0M31_018889 [Melipona bicolor]
MLRQNDIKKLRRENEQLRREIWSLRDEYDKLEEILKRQKCRPESEEYEVARCKSPFLVNPDEGGLTDRLVDFPDFGYLIDNSSVVSVAKNPDSKDTDGKSM